MLLLHEIPLAVVFKYERRFPQSVISSVGGSRRPYALTSDEAAELLRVSLVW